MKILVGEELLLYIEEQMEVLKDFGILKHERIKIKKILSDSCENDLQVEQKLRPIKFYKITAAEFIAKGGNYD